MSSYLAWVEHLSVGGYRNYLLVVLFITLALLIAGVYFIRRTYWIINTPTSKIASAHQGYIEIEGVAKQIDSAPLASPLSGDACVWFWVEVAQKENKFGDSSQSTWRRVYSHQSDQLISVQDESGTCLVDPDLAHIHPGLVRNWYGDSERPVGGLMGAGARLFANYRYTEKLLLADHPIYVLGWFKTITHDAYQAEHESVKALLSEWKSDPAKMKSFDQDGNGVIDGQEWHQARLLAQKITQERRITETYEPNHTHVIGANCQSRRPYLISAVDQTTLARRFRRWGYSLWGLSMLSFFLLMNAYYVRP
ncbi:MAG TPA: GIDE domain-containing protein [Halothiobacillus sp.]|nr:MAG: hypothetical protein B7Z82_02110 [Halothiobacillus sp. 20-54-6]HQT43566.1 GIDE domain-containing protein [Halothiobacillus sp.]